jgi:uncharacterized damage-inducible protein DinB
MDMLDRFLGHDLATTRQLLRLCLTLSDEEMDRAFDAGPGSIRRTFAHMIGNIEVWTALMMARPGRTRSGEDSARALLRRLEAAYEEFASFARETAAQGRLDALWLDVLDEPATEKSFGGAIGHVITHNMHHRAELLHMMHRLGMEAPSGLRDLPEGDLMSWDQHHRLSD